MSTEKPGDDFPQIPPLVADLPLGVALPWRIIHRGEEWLGEVLAAERWEPEMGKAREKGCRFRIVLFTQPQDVPPPEDAGVAFCLPARLSYTQEEQAREYRALKEERAGYQVKGEEERRLAGELIKEETALYSQGNVLTCPPLALSPSEIFSLPTMKERLDFIASALIAAWEVAAISSELVAVKSYLEKAEVGEGELDLDRVSLLGQLEMDNLLAHPHLWPHIKALFDWFRSRYGALYRAHHRRYHQELSSLYSRLEEAEAKVKALERLNSLTELGEPVGAGYYDEYKELLRLASPCPQWDRDEVQLESHPLCPRCGLVLTSSSPQRRVENFLSGLEKALKEQHRRLSSEAVRQILARSKERRIDRFLKVLQASDLTPLVNVLDDELVEFLRELLAEGRLLPGAQREEPPPLTTL